MKCVYWTALNYFIWNEKTKNFQFSNGGWSTLNFSIIIHFMLILVNIIYTSHELNLCWWCQMTFWSWSQFFLVNLSWNCVFILLDFFFFCLSHFPDCGSSAHFVIFFQLKRAWGRDLFVICLFRLFFFFFTVGTSLFKNEQEIIVLAQV